MKTVTKLASPVTTRVLTQFVEAPVDVATGIKPEIVVFVGCSVPFLAELVALMGGLGDGVGEAVLFNH